MRPKQVNSDPGNEALRQIPAVEALLNRNAVRKLESRFGRDSVVEVTRNVLDSLRDKILRNPAIEVQVEATEAEIIRAVEASSQTSLGPVVNATGVILHTNLGRAPLAQEAIKQVLEVAAGYSNLEFDLEMGSRGKRDLHTERLFRELLGAESTLVVNNNAAGLFLALNTLAEGHEVVVSRGEMVEIGGSFRVPEICSKSGCILREVGTTNRTRISDYAQAINEKTRAILRVHPSNFRIVGFTERTELESLVSLAHQHGVVLVEDLGSGCLTDLRPAGLVDEPMVQASLGAGVDVAGFSGDKLLGGPQSGILVGKRDLLARIRGNPLFRALRVDKMTIAALQATISLYLRQRLVEIPAQRMIRTTKQEITVRAEHLAQQLANLEGFSAKLNDGESVAGGGSTPGQFLPTTLIVITHATISSQDLAQLLRRHHPPIIARVEQDQTLLDLRTVFEHQEEEIFRAFQSIAVAG